MKSRGLEWSPITHSPVSQILVYVGPQHPQSRPPAWGPGTSPTFLWALACSPLNTHRNEKGHTSLVVHLTSKHLWS